MPLRALLVVCLLATACTAAEDAGSADGAGAATAASQVEAADPSEPPTGSVAPSPAPSASARGDRPTALQPSEGFAVSAVVFTDGTREITMPVWVADAPDLRRRGLMFRRELPADAGMLFTYDEPNLGSFWMKNTLLPLTVAFVGQDGTVQQLVDMEPCVADPCRSYHSDAPYLYAVEANQGYFAERGIVPGWTLQLRAPTGG